jgi:hypothetical protein
MSNLKSFFSRRGYLHQNQGSGIKKESQQEMARITHPWGRDTTLFGVAAMARLRILIVRALRGLNRHAAASGGAEKQADRGGLTE